MHYFLFLIATFLFISCTDSQKEIAKNSEGFKTHKIKSEELKLIMHNLENLIFDEFYSELDREREHILYGKKLSSIAIEISNDISKVESISNSLPLIKSNKNAFLDLASDLRAKANIVKHSIDNGESRVLINRAVTNLIISCNRCHEKYRDTK